MIRKPSLKDLFADCAMNAHCIRRGQAGGRVRPEEKGGLGTRGCLCSEREEATGQTTGSSSVQTRRSGWEAAITYLPSLEPEAPLSSGSSLSDECNMASPPCMESMSVLPRKRMIGNEKAEKGDISVKKRFIDYNGEKMEFDELFELD